MEVQFILSTGKPFCDGIMYLSTGQFSVIVMTEAHNNLIAEYFRRPQISKEADVMNQILKSNCTVRMRSYIETGCRVHCQNISNINQLSSCENGLKDHIKKDLA
ncbi:hypothetical protein ZEAMMB73_Zm00001d012867 [Zea mays]|uniref:DUF7795 domain-containing protein n=1 Tax=Zea mays TaxID=4577 RepID=A0A1D6GDI2_MAIZE|nr:hypothetical protein ZEAMMB73_Zm00001d012867 [Zea mays]